MIISSCAMSFSSHVFAELFIERFCMTGGNSPIGYLKAYSTNLYLSADPSKVREALEEGRRRRLDEGAPLPWHCEHLRSDALSLSLSSSVFSFYPLMQA